VLEFGFVASEGHFSIPLDAKGNSGVFSVASHFCEFIPVKEREADPDNRFPKTLLAHELKPGESYYILVSGSHGLYRYDINDIVECTGMFNATPMIRFLHKGGNMLSITGEKVGESHAVSAVTAASTECGVHLDGFSVTVRMDETPRYIFAVEPHRAVSVERMTRLLHMCDEKLCHENVEYESKRHTGRLAPPVLLTLRHGSFDRYRMRRVKDGAPDAHVKPPHMFKDEDGLRAALEVVGELWM
jgi:hypothetical protein